MDLLMEFIYNPMMRQRVVERFLYKSLVHYTDGILIESGSTARDDPVPDFLLAMRWISEISRPSQH